MTYDEFSKLLGGGWYDEIEACCQNACCINTETCKKGSALVNFKRNGKFLCRSCSFTPEGRQRISKSSSYKRSEESKAKMSESANMKWQTDWGKKQKKKLARQAARGHSTNKFNKSKRKIAYISAKNGGGIRTCNSSYEYIYCEYFLEIDPEVVSYETQVYYKVEDRDRSLDFLITYKDGSKKVVEIKPAKRLYEDYFVGQLLDSAANAEANSWDFAIVTEVELGITKCKDATALADEYRKKHYEIDMEEYRKRQAVKRSQKYYETHIKPDMISVACEFCQEEHTVMRLQYDNNVKKNGRFICIKENGHIVGSKPKLWLRKENPYAELGQKQCTKCDRILPFECFGSDKSRRDGYANKCKECRCRKK